MIEHEQIKTTLPKAKELKPDHRRQADHAGQSAAILHARRLAAAQMKAGHRLSPSCSNVLGERYADRPGGYTRVLKAGFRYGDMAPMAIIEFVDRDLDAKGAADKARLAAEEAADEE